MSKFLKKANTKFEEFTDDELQVIKRSLMDSIARIVFDQEGETCPIHEKLCSEIIEEIKRRDNK